MYDCSHQARTTVLYRYLYACFFILPRICSTICLDEFWDARWLGKLLQDKLLLNAVFAPLKFQMHIFSERPSHKFASMHISLSPTLPLFVTKRHGFFCCLLYPLQTFFLLAGKNTHFCSNRWMPVLWLEILF